MEDDVKSTVRLLAYYDVRGVANPKLAEVFRCRIEDLNGARDTEEYKEALATERAEFEAARAEMDDNWDSVERKALGNLIEVLGDTTDPRMLLSAATLANKANRRNAAQAVDQPRKVIDVTPDAGGRTTVVRMRTRFLEILQSEEGARQVAARETEITISNQASMREDMTPTEVEHMLKTSLGVDVRDVEEITRRGNSEDALNFDFNVDSPFIKRLSQ